MISVESIFAMSSRTKIAIIIQDKARFKRLKTEFSNG